MKKVYISLVALIATTSTPKYDLWRTMTESDRRSLIGRALPELSQASINEASKGLDKRLPVVMRSQVTKCVPKVYGEDTAIGFSIINEGPEPVFFSVINKDSTMINMHRIVSDSDNITRFINITVPTYVYIWKTKPSE